MHEPVSGEAGGSRTLVTAVAVASDLPATLPGVPLGSFPGDPPATLPSRRRPMLDGTVDIARDRDLVERCQRGDGSAFAELYHRYHRRLQRFCLRRLHGPDDAEEAVQEAFTRAWRALPRFGGERRFYPWLTVIAANVCTDILRRRSRLVPMDEVPVRPTELSETEVDEQLLRQVDLAMATEALGHLSDRHQRVLRLREGSGWTAQMIAEHEGVAVPAVDTLLWRARQAFKREFAALADAGGRFAGVLGLGAVAGWRSLSRTGARSAARAAPLTHLRLRGPGTLAASVALVGAAAAGGGIALVGSAPAEPHHASTTPSSSAGSPTGQSGLAGSPRSGGGAGGVGDGGQSKPGGAPSAGGAAGSGAPAGGAGRAPGGSVGSVGSVFSVFGTPGSATAGRSGLPAVGLPAVGPPAVGLPVWSHAGGAPGSGTGGLMTGLTSGPGVSGTPPIAGASTRTSGTIPSGLSQSTVTTLKAITTVGL